MTRTPSRSSGAQMLRVRGSKVVGEKILEVFHVLLAVFGLCVLQDTASTRNISRFCTANTAILTVFWSLILCNTAVVEVFWGAILWNTVWYLKYFKDLVFLIL